MPSKPISHPIDSLTRSGDLVKKLDGKTCYAQQSCEHLYKLRPGQRGVCKVRFNSEGTLMVPFGYSAGLQNDPIEKKPFFHAIPGSWAMSFGMLGCDFRCAYCQNWFTSQSLKDEASSACAIPNTARKYLIKLFGMGRKWWALGTPLTNC
ncbi:MAG: hypothetical protein VB778_00060 [Nitrospinaceae bacterium]